MSKQTSPEIAEPLALALDMLTGLKEVASGYRAQLIADYWSTENAERAATEALIEMQRMIMRNATTRGDDDEGDM